MTAPAAAVTRRWQYISEHHLHGQPAYRVACPVCSWETPADRPQPTRRDAAVLGAHLHPVCGGVALPLPIPARAATR